MHPLILLTSVPLFLPLLLTLPTPAQTACCSHPAWNSCLDGTPVTPCCGYRKCNGFCCHCKGSKIVPVPVTIWNGINEAGKYISTSMMTAPPGSTIYCRTVAHSMFGGRVLTVSEKTYFNGDPRYSWKRGVEEDVHRKTVAIPDASAAEEALAATTPTTWLLHKEELSGTVNDATPAFIDRPLSTPLSTAPPISRSHHDASHDDSHCDSIFHRISNGTGVIDLPAYLGFFGLETQESLHERDLNAEVEIDEVRGVKRENLRDVVVRHFYERDLDGDGVLGREEIEMLL